MTEKADNQIGQYTLEIPTRIVHVTLTRDALDRRKKRFNDTKDRWSVDFLFDPGSEALKAAKKVCAAVFKAAFPAAKPSEIDFPFHDGTELADDAQKDGKNKEFMRGKVVLRTSAPREPVFSQLKGSTWSDATADRFYSGCFAVAQLNFKDYKAVKKQDNDGVKAYLNMLGFHSDGERIGGRDPNVTFANVKGKATEENPFTDDEEIPF